MESSTLTEFFEGINDIDITRLMKEYDIKIYKKNDDIYDIINTILEQRNISEEAFYIVDIGKIIRQFLRWKECLPQIEPFYAIKCNPNPLILKVLGNLGCNFDCASKNEIASVISITNDPKRIVFANPCKMSNQIKYARANDVDLMTFDSDHELYKIKLYHPYSELLMRIKVDDTQSQCRFSCKFGVEFDEAREILSIAKSLKLKVVGIAFHVGSNAGSLEQYSNAIIKAKQYFDMALEEFGMEFTILDIGGGFPGVNINSDIQFEDIAKTIMEAIDEQFENRQNLKLMAEPGRFLAANSHTLVCNVIGKKEIINNGEKEFVYYLNDGLYGSFNCVFFDHATPEICPFNERDNAKKYNSKIFGPTCDALDMINECVQLPELAIGEWCYVENFGAYTQAAASSFNGFCQNEPIYVLTC